MRSCGSWKFPYLQLPPKRSRGTVRFQKQSFRTRSGDAERSAMRVDFATCICDDAWNRASMVAHQLIAVSPKGSNLLSEGLTENATMAALMSVIMIRQEAPHAMHRGTHGHSVSLTTADFEKMKSLVSRSEGQGYLNY